MMQEDSCCIKIPSAGFPQCQSVTVVWRSYWASGCEGPAGAAAADAVARALLGHKRLLAAAARRRGGQVPAPALGTAAGDDPLAGAEGAYLRLLRLHAHDVRRLAAANALAAAACALPAPTLDDVRRRHLDAAPRTADGLSDETGYNSGRSSPCSSTTLSPEASMCEVQTVLMHGEEQTPADAFAPQTAGTEAEEADEDADETLKPSDVADQLEGSVEVEEEEEEASAEVTLTEDGQDKAWEETLQHHRDFLNKVSSQLIERPTSVNTDESNACGTKDTGALTDHRLELSEEQLQEDVQAVLRSLDEALVAHGLEDDSANEEEKKAPEENRVKEHFADKLMNETNEHTIGKENRVLKEVFQKDDYSSEPLANPIQREKKRVRFNVDFQDTEGKKRKEVALRRKRRTKIPCRNSFYNTDGYESDDDQYYQFSWSLQNASPRNVKYQRAAEDVEEVRSAESERERERERERGRGRGRERGCVLRPAMLTLRVEVARAAGQRLQRHLARLAASGCPQPPALQVEVLVAGGGPLGPAVRLHHSDAASFYASLLAAAWRGRWLGAAATAAAAAEAVSAERLALPARPARPLRAPQPRPQWALGGGDGADDRHSPTPPPPMEEEEAAEAQEAAPGAVEMPAPRRRLQRWLGVAAEDGPLAEVWSLYRRIWSIVTRLRARRRELRAARQQHAAAIATITTTLTDGSSNPPKEDAAFAKRIDDKQQQEEDAEMGDAGETCRCDSEAAVLCSCL